MGDRLELLSIVSTAIAFKKPIIHIHGGERTEGAIDEQIRHMVTKASHIHFAACDEYASNILRMGEESWRVHNVGALAVDNMMNLSNVKKDELFSQLNLDLNQPTVLLTYHPVTLEFELSPIDQIKNVFESLNQFDFQVLITAPNLDNDRDLIFSYIEKQVSSNPKLHYLESLGVKRYLNLLPYCSFVIGNSSSAIIEVPYYKIPVINIGDRQKGRIMHENIISCSYSVESIKDGIKKTLNTEFCSQLRGMIYKFGEGNTAIKMLEIIRKIDINEQLLRKQLVFNQ